MVSSQLQLALIISHIIRAGRKKFVIYARILFL